MQPIVYLCFNGNCGEAFNFYEKALNGKIEFSQTFGEAPMPSDDQHKDLIMHISLDTNGGKIFGSDAPGEHAVTFGNNFGISLNPTTEEECDRLYAALSEGGVQTMPMAETFWTKRFGMCTDKFGVNWMISYADPNAKMA